ncbi:hypothetical protein [Sphingomonas sp. NFR15]|uniref:hypothetical protein n=1 Tax=Sphingomonas sp. NFR15 TaxID=1566282 RepID=UPI000886C004|nr:hypothetical protein [Sphingomonas sp. NFR15]SDA25214.1 hypothetical protein SAMN03159340_01844 [Sphingomonas sp. NFR15]
MWAITCLGLALASVSASASQPTGKTFGPWHVVSISSLSGTEGNDASVVLTQGEEPNTLQARWTDGGPVVVSINIEKCSGENDFEAVYSVEVARWLRLSQREVQKRLRSDMTTWLDQARLACRSPAVVTAFKMTDLDRAAMDFTERLKYFAGDRSVPALVHRHRRKSVSLH